MIAIPALVPPVSSCCSLFDPQLAEAILKGRQSVELTATRATRTRSAAGLDEAAQTARKLNRNSGQMCPGRGPAAAARRCKRSKPRRWETASRPFSEKRRRRPGSPPARPFSRPRPPAERRQTAGAFRAQPWGSPLRQTGCWRKPYRTLGPTEESRRPRRCRITFAPTSILFGK